MPTFNISPYRQQVLVRGSVALNLCLVLYLSLSAGWRLEAGWGLIDSASPDTASNTYGRNIQYFVDRNENSGGQSSTCPPSSPSSLTPATFYYGGALTVAEGVFCFNKENTFSQSRRGNYWVLSNYVRAAKSFRCNDTITYTTHGDFTFIDNLEPLIDRWRAPASVAVYAPGSDFQHSIETILYFRDCRDNTLVKDYVSFHIFFDLKHIPSTIPSHTSMAGRQGNCSYRSDWRGFVTYKKNSDLIYPVNVARNVARKAATTHFVFPSDIELYPSPGLVPAFLEMVRRGDGPGAPNKPRVYVNSIFEVSENVTELPQDKAELVRMLTVGTAIPFHKQVCAMCHSIPYSKNWTTTPVRPGMRVLGVGKRVRPYQHWEPIYIGTNQEPEYDERLSWEGRADKMIQGYKLCVLDYEFHILDNAFLVHRPGIKTKKALHNSLNSKKVSAQTELIRKVISPEVKALYGARKGCELL